ncbi:MAG: hypothetical protein IBX63_09685 [Coriobacteriia bacterium]|nr:hypothetical protein [Coriobacteriia bacterium]
MADFCDYLSLNTRNVYQRVAFMHLFYGPLRWRQRRTDSFELLDVDTVYVSSRIDVRVSVALLEEIMGDCEVLLGARSPEVRELRKVFARLRHPSPGEVIERIELLLPVMWLDHPLMTFTIESGGRKVIPLSRRAGSDVVSRAMTALLTADGQEFGMPHARRVEEIQDLAWCLAAANIHGVRLEPVWREFRAVGNVDEVPPTLEVLVQWMHDNFVRAGFGSEEAFAAIERRQGRVQELMRSSLVTGRNVVDVLSQQGDMPDCVPLSNPALNPLLLHEAFLRRQMTRIAAPAPAPDALVDEFLRVAAHWLRMIRWAEQTSYSPHPESKAFARMLLDHSVHLAHGWPAIARMSLPIGTDSCLVVGYSVWEARRLVDRYLRDPSRPLPRKLLRVGLAVLRQPWDAIVRRTAASATSALGLTRRSWTPVDTFALPLHFRDALGYHVEVSSSHAGLSLVPAGAYVERRTTTSPANAGRRASRVRSRSEKRTPRDFFDRVSDGSCRVHHYYFSRAHPGVETLDGNMPDTRDIRGRLLLVERYAVPGYVEITNWLLALLVLVVSLCTGLGYLHPTSAWPSTTIIRTLVTVYLGVVVLFAVERHNSPIVIHKLKYPAAIVVVSFLLLLAGIGFRWPEWVDMEAALLPSSRSEEYTQPSKESGDASKASSDRNRGEQPRSRRVPAADVQEPATPTAVPGSPD